MDALGAIARRPARRRGPARARWPRSSPASAPARARGWRRSSAGASTASSSPPPRPTTCTTASTPRLAAIAEALVRDARARAQFSGAETRALSIASLRATVEQTVTRDGREIDVVRGRLDRHRRGGRALPRQPARGPGADPRPGPPGRGRLDRRRLPRHPLRAAAARAGERRRPAAHPPRPRRRVPDRRPPDERAPADDPFVIPADDLAPATATPADAPPPPDEGRPGAAMQQRDPPRRAAAPRRRCSGPSLGSLVTLVVSVAA